MGRRDDNYETDPLTGKRIKYCSWRVSEGVQCGVPHTNSSVWCTPHGREYHRDYQRKRKEEEGAGYTFCEICRTTLDKRNRQPGAGDVCRTCTLVVVHLTNSTPETIERVVDRVAQLTGHSAPQMQMHAEETYSDYLEYWRETLPELEDTQEQREIYQYKCEQKGFLPVFDTPKPVEPPLKLQVPKGAISRPGIQLRPEDLEGWE